MKRKRMNFDQLWSGMWHNHSSITKIVSPCAGVDGGAAVAEAKTEHKNEELAQQLYELQMAASPLWVLKLHEALYKTLEEE